MFFARFTPEFFGAVLAIIDRAQWDGVPENGYGDRTPRKVVLKFR